MAQLFRFLFTDDRSRSEVFTFMIPSNFILDMDTELKSRDFTSSNQKWSLSFHKNNGLLNTYLTLKSCYEGMIVTADYGITLINREHFTRNESFYEKNARFTYDNQSQGRKAFVSIEALCTLDFMDERGNIQCELEIKNVNTGFTYDAQIPPTPSYIRNLSELKYVSGTFSFGNYEWNVCIQPKMDSMGSITCLKFYLCRLSSLDHLCRISYRYKFINGGFVHDSGIIEQYSDINGASNSYRMDKIKELLQMTGKFVIRIDLIKVNSVFPIILYPFSNQPQPVHFYDRDRQAWMMESCVEDNCFILRLFYTDINNIPSGYVRVMSFNISVRHQNSAVYVFKKPVIKYYYKRESDDGLEITTTIDVNEIMSENGGYLDQDEGITIEMELYYSHLLHQPEYSHLDDIIRKQKLQMHREIQALQQENYSLEKQLHTLQGANVAPNPAQGPRTKSFENASASSTASSGVGTSISSLNTTNPNLSNVNQNGQVTPNVVKKYYEQKYGSTTNMSTGGPNQNMGMSSGSSQLDKNNQQYQQQQQQQQQQKNGSSRTGSDFFNQTFGQSNPNQIQNNNSNNPDNPLGAGLSSLTSTFTSGIANLKLTATNFQANKFTSKLMNPFS
ncbi:unnamed protein product [Brachionus calyciflorus]|uniref:MATH domain-containing protein n=1 Tax=Brachionus calyciflorus TaxID=104777 RepID=A0A813RJ13_9BILA|nr:unnamed protein product [Brachionus calyciflorus]